MIVADTAAAGKSRGEVWWGRHRGRGGDSVSRRGGGGGGDSVPEGEGGGGGDSLPGATVAGAVIVFRGERGGRGGDSLAEGWEGKGW
jgi:hypothetical protein